MAKAQNGDTVKVHYTGKLEDGTVFDTSKNNDPLQFILGKGQVLPDFEESVVGMNQGESKTITIEAQNAYGPYNEERVVELDRKQLPEHINPQVDQQLQVQLDSGQKITVTVTDVSESSITLDANHPLAGKDLTFDIQLIEIT